jgi:hypothetical protein
MLTDLEEVLTQIKTLAKSARGWITEKRVEKEDGIFIEISVTFKRDLTKANSCVNDIKIGLT